MVAVIRNRGNNHLMLYGCSGAPPAENTQGVQVIDTFTGTVETSTSLFDQPLPSRVRVVEFHLVVVPGVIRHHPRLTHLFNEHLLIVIIIGRVPNAHEAIMPPVPKVAQSGICANKFDSHKVNDGICNC
jgi:hypothetical protein